MDLVSRLIEILRANLHLNSGETVSERRRRYEPHERTVQRGAHESAKGDSQRPDQDPELAGYYANLEIPYGSDAATVRRAWKQLLRKYHPDLYSGDPEKQRIANELTQQLNHAHEELMKRLEE